MPSILLPLTLDRGFILIILRRFPLPVRKRTQLAVDVSTIPRIPPAIPWVSRFDARLQILSLGSVAGQQGKLEPTLWSNAAAKEQDVQRVREEIGISHELLIRIIV